MTEVFFDLLVFNYCSYNIINHFHFEMSQRLTEDNCDMQEEEDDQSLTYGELLNMGKWIDEDSQDYICASEDSCSSDNELESTVASSDQNDGNALSEIEQVNQNLISPEQFIVPHSNINLHFPKSDLLPVDYICRVITSSINSLICGMKFDNACLLHQHNARAHFNSNRFVCSGPGCDFATSTAEILMEHQFIHNAQTIDPQQCFWPVLPKYYRCTHYSCLYRLIPCCGPLPDSHWLKEHQDQYHNGHVASYLIVDNRRVGSILHPDRRICDRIYYPFWCNEIICSSRLLVCHCGFTSGYLLNQHKVLMHNHRDTFICTYPSCEYATSNSTAFHLHQLSHSSASAPALIIQQPMSMLEYNSVCGIRRYHKRIEILDVLTANVDRVKMEDEIRYAMYHPAPNMPQIPQFIVYSLSLKNGNYYVGESEYLSKRMYSHFKGRGSLWTSKHAPIAINYVQACPNKASALIEEERIYFVMVGRYGRDHVRGSKWCSI